MNYEIAYECIAYDKKEDTFITFLKDNNKLDYEYPFIINEKTYNIFINNTDINCYPEFRNMINLLFEKPELFKDDKQKKELIENDIYVVGNRLEYSDITNKDMIVFEIHDIPSKKPQYQYGDANYNYKHMKYELNMCKGDCAYENEDEIEIYITFNGVENCIIAKTFDDFKLVLEKACENVDDPTLKKYPFYFISELYKLIKTHNDYTLVSLQKNVWPETWPVFEIDTYNLEVRIEKNKSRPIDAMKVTRTINCDFKYNKTTANEILRTIRNEIML